MPASEESSHKARILLVDDEPLVLKMLHAFLSSQGYQVTCAPGGHDALAVIERQHSSIDLLITDIRMPDMNGIRLLEAVRQLHPSLPVLLMTGYSDFDLVVEGLKQHAFDLLLKPIDFEQLVWCIAKALAFQTAQRLEQQYRMRLEQQVAKQTKLLCEQLEALQDAQRKADSAQALKREFLNLIRAIPPLKEAISTHQDHDNCAKTLCQSMTDLVHRFNETATQIGIRFTTSCKDVPSHQLTGPWDAVQIITTCLLDNAFTFTGHNGEVIFCIWTEHDAEDQHAATVLIQVCDNGIGIPISHQELVFHPLTQVEHDLTQCIDGDGISLIIVRTLCDKLGGSLKLESSPENGSCITCRLPFKVVQPVVASS